MNKLYLMKIGLFFSDREDVTSGVPPNLDFT